MADAAQAAGLSSWALSDHVRRDSAWVPQYVQRVRGCQQTADLLFAVEAKILHSRRPLNIPPTWPAWTTC